KEIEETLEKISEKDSKEMLANLGRKIFIPVEIKDKTLIVEVGNKTFVKKSIPETKKLISEQMEKLTSARVQILERLEELQEEMQRMIDEIQKNEHTHKHDGKCKCGHEH
ncbi:MAG: prefoldin subunit alpha, partial [Candidatus Nanoarchaeia archaeon]|nr:prefoldin subunit alpha [Candidatus Nanoarchaeia archaeon]